jgi:DNA polymerase III delta prime subunit
MSFTEETKQHVKQVATESLHMLTQVAEIANDHRAYKGLGADSFASVNTLNTIAAAQSLAQVNLASQVSNQILSDEPAIARVVVLTQSGDERVYYICRATPVTGAPGLLASYKAPVGRLASLPVGDSFRLPNGEMVEVLERTRLRPTRLLDVWDSKESVFEGDKFGPFTIESLRALLLDEQTPEKLKDLLSQVLANDAQEVQVFEGIRKERITKMGLRDQPVLDKYQDEIFRLPLDQRLLILGPPGTGKTTTLIRRLGQKIDTTSPDSLSDGERQTIDRASPGGIAAHPDSWLMFTPTELLKQYLKEAFNRERVPASDKRLKTWIDYRRELGRNVLGILRLPGAGGLFTLKEQALTLHVNALSRPSEWFNAFNAWQRQTFVQDMQTGVQTLVSTTHPQAAQVGMKIAAVLTGQDSSNMASLFVELQAESAGLQSLVAELKAASDQRIDDVLNLTLNKNSRFLDELGQFIDQLQANTTVETEDDADTEADDEDDPSVLKTGRGPAISAFRSALRAQARSAATKRVVPKGSKNAQIIEWLGDRSLKPEHRASIGTQLVLLSAARRFVGPVKRYLDGIPRRYRAFRKAQQDAATWYRPESFPATDIHPLELDIVILTSLRAAGDLLRSATIARRVQDTYWSALQTVQGLYKNQILVDEATDFSPVQLACMAALANPQLRSFFACGDFNQRLTTWGSQSVDELKWFFPEIEVRRVSVSYRQSRQLNDLARAIIQELGGDTQDASLPPHVNNDGERPALLELADSDKTQIWLADQIRYIASYLKQLPSTAIFVNSEAEIQPLADALNEILEDDNIQVVACPKGQVMGNDNDVRVFDIQHIKGLEFEAVFFVGIDTLAERHPDLFAKFLYVGTTRAATYLGITCAGGLPSSMEPLRSHFTSAW